MVLEIKGTVFLRKRFYNPMEFYEEKKSYAALQDNISVTTESLRDLLHSYMLNL